MIYQSPKGGPAGAYAVRHNVHAVANTGVGRSMMGALKSGLISGQGPWGLIYAPGAQFASDENPNDYVFYPGGPTDFGGPGPGVLVEIQSLVDAGWTDTNSAWFSDGGVALAFLDNYQPGFSHTIVGRLLGQASGAAESALGTVIGNQQLANNGVRSAAVNLAALGGRSQTPQSEAKMQADLAAASPWWHLGELGNPLFGGPAIMAPLGLLGVGPAAQGGTVPNPEPGPPSLPPVLGLAGTFLGLPIGVIVLVVTILAIVLISIVIATRG